MTDQMSGEWIPPDPGEPIPPPAPDGATDAGLGGIEVSPADLTEEEAGLVAGLLGLPDAAAVTGAPTWAAVYAKARSYLGAYPPERKRENVNLFTHWFYGTWNIAAAWCFIFVSYCLAMAGATQSAGLALIGGKRAWVPDIMKIGGARFGASGMTPGAVCAIGGFSHIGFCVSHSGGSFLLLSGNSTSGSSTDAITVKRYSDSIASGHVNLAYATVTPPKPKPPAPADADEYDEWVA